MFGLMRGRGAERRRHYCGTCKTIGQQYGQAARLLLNHDTVFLGELLTHVAGEDTLGWESAYQRKSCFAKPRELPVALQFAAAATVVLSDAKAADHEEDSGRRWWKWLRHSLAGRNRKAEAALRAWGLPISELREVLRSQKRLEREPAGMAGWSAPTAHATGLFFRHGAEVVGRSDLSSPMYEAGQRFGRLVYVLDAWEDYERDGKRGEFNALRAEFGARRRDAVEDACLEAERELRVLGCDLFAARLRGNVRARLGLTLPVVCSCEMPKVAAFADGLPPAGATIADGAAKKATKSRDCGCCNCCSSDDGSTCDACCQIAYCFDCCSSCEWGGCCECGSCDC